MASLPELDLLIPGLTGTPVLQKRQLIVLKLRSQIKSACDLGQRAVRNILDSPFPPPDALKASAPHRRMRWKQPPPPAYFDKGQTADPPEAAPKTVKLSFEARLAADKLDHASFSQTKPHLEQHGVLPGTFSCMCCKKNVKGGLTQFRGRSCPCSNACPVVTLGSQQCLSENASVPPPPAPYVGCASQSTQGGKMSFAARQDLERQLHCSSAPTQHVIEKGACPGTFLCLCCGKSVQNDVTLFRKRPCPCTVENCRLRAPRPDSCHSDDLPSAASPAPAARISFQAHLVSARLLHESCSKDKPHVISRQGVENYVCICCHKQTSTGLTYFRRQICPCTNQHCKPADNLGNSTELSNFPARPLQSLRIESFRHPVVGSAADTSADASFRSENHVPISAASLLQSIQRETSSHSVLDADELSAPAFSLASSAVANLGSFAFHGSVLLGPSSSSCTEFVEPAPD
jgi:hypothetical protein